jgi:hypothetical protein
VSGRWDRKIKRKVEGDVTILQARTGDLPNPQSVCGEMYSYQIFVSANVCWPWILRCVTNYEGRPESLDC